MTTHTLAKVCNFVVLICSKVKSIVFFLLCFVFLSEITYLSGEFGIDKTINKRNCTRRLQVRKEVRTFEYALIVVRLLLGLFS